MTFTRWSLAILVVGILAAGLGAGFLLGAGNTAGDGGEQAATPQKWHCPMHPEYVSDGPGSCPICGMDLVPIKDTQTRDDDTETANLISGLSTVHLTDAKRQLTGVTTAPVEFRTLQFELRAPAVVKPDETTMRTVNTKIGGWVEKLFVQFEGTEIRSGQPMLTIYSPQLYQTQQEYLTALKLRSTLSSSQFEDVQNAGNRMVAAAERRLRLWDISPAQIKRLRSGGAPRRTMTIHAPVTGIVTKRLVEAGAEIGPGAPLFHVVDLSTVWVEADIYEQDMAAVSEGQIATVEFDAFPGEQWNGRIEFVYPYLEGETRTVAARISVRNPRGRLKPQMYGQMRIEAPPKHVLAVPEESIVDTGERQVAYVQTQQGVYEPRQVTTGEASDGFIEVLDGLQEGQRVVERGLFMIDSESRLKASVASSDSH